MTPYVAHRNAIREHHVDPEACRQLWCAVIEEGVRAAFRPYATETPAQRSQARAWFGTRDFSTVCALAGVEASALAAKLRADLAARGVR